VAGSHPRLATARHRLTLAGLEEEKGSAFGARRVVALYTADLTGRRFMLFYDPESNRRILLSTFPRDGIFGTFVSQVYPAPYGEEPTFLAMEIGKRFADDIARSSQDYPGNE